MSDTKQPTPHFHTETPFAQATKTLFEELQLRQPQQSPVVAYIAGGVAIHLYTASRVSGDIDAHFSRHLEIPEDLYIEVKSDKGIPQLLHFDRNYNSTFALMHEDYESDSVEVPFGFSNMHVRVLSPVDLVVSKIARFLDHDKGDIQALVAHGLTTAAAIERRAQEAVGGFVGDKTMLMINIREAIDIARAAELRNLGFDMGTAKSAESGRQYTGRVLTVDSCVVMQDVDAMLVRHDRMHLTGSMSMLRPGQAVQIRYPQGEVGLVSEAVEMGMKEKSVNFKVQGPDFGV